MRIRGMSLKTQQAHIRAVRSFAEIIGRSPDPAMPDELRAYQLHITDAGVSTGVFHARIVSLRLFFGITRGREEMKRYMQFRRKAKKLPVVLSVEEVDDLLAAVPGPGLRGWARLFRRLFLDGLKDLHHAGQLTFFGDLDDLVQQDTFAQWPAPFRKTEWVVYAFSGASPVRS